MKRELLVWSGLILGLLLLGAGAVFGPRLLEERPAIQIPGDPQCNLHKGPCSVALPGGGTMSLSITPRPIAAMKPMQMDVSFSGVGASDVVVDFKGADMNMGLNRFPLSDQGKDHFGGQAVIPVCVRKRMVWDAWVIADTDHGRYSAPFRFVTTQP